MIKLTETSMADRRANELIAAVADAAGLTQERIANGSGYTREHVSRVLSGQYAVPPEIASFLFRVTHDRRVLTAILGDQADELVYIPELTKDLGDLDPHVALASAQVAWGELQTSIARQDRTAAGVTRRRSAAESVARHLMAYLRRSRTALASTGSSAA